MSPHQSRSRHPEGWEQFRSQRRMAGVRGIPFLFTFEEWWAWWQIDGRWLIRGRTRGCVVMARRGDVGPYNPDNVYCASLGENALDRAARLTPDDRAAMSARKFAMHAARPEIADHLRDRANHPMRKEVRTPEGTFPSGSLAADHYGLTRQAVYARIRAGKPGWAYVGG